MNITIPVSCEGDYRLVVSKDQDCKSVVAESGICNNLVLNSGFNIICRSGLVFSSSGTANSMRVLVVGSSNAEPTPTQTSLVSQIASVSLVSSNTTRWFSTNYDRGYIEMTFSRQFPQGAVVGNVSEVGCGYSNTELLSRALIRDTEGNPTTITVLNDEFLTVHYSFRMFFPKNDITHATNVVVDGVTVPTSVTVRAVDCGRDIPWDTGISFAPSTAVSSGLSTSETLDPNTGALSSPTFRMTPVVQPYVENSFARYSVFTFGTSDAISSNLRRLTFANNAQSFQYLITPPIQKTNQQVLTIKVGLQIGRPE